VCERERESVCEREGGIDREKKRERERESVCEREGEIDREKKRERERETEGRIYKREKESEIGGWRAKRAFFCLQGRNTNYIPAGTKGFW
jgi:hypothetical protein